MNPPTDTTPVQPPPRSPDTAAPRRPWVAVLLALTCNGLGHAYAGRFWAGVAIHVGWLALLLATVVVMGRGLAALAIGLAAALAGWLAQAGFAARVARLASPGPRPWSSRPLGLAALYCASLLLALGLQALAPVFPTRPWYCPSASMTPTLLQGDLFMATQPSVISRGDVVVHRLPGGRDPGLKRVVGLPGDEVEVRNGHLLLNGTLVERRRLDAPCAYEAESAGRPWRSEPCVGFIEVVDGRSYHVQCSPDRPCGDVAPMHIPTGHVVVLGDFRDHAADSRVYGPVPMSAVIGVARYVYFSLGPNGVRWERLGLEIR